MQCFHPVRLRGPDSDPLPCGKCFACQSNRRRDWHFRIKYEMLHSLYSLTVTLTYDNEHLPDWIPHYPPHDTGGCDEFDQLIKPDPDYYYHPYVIDHVQRFFKRLRKKYNFRYFGVAEYGGKRGRPHYHIIFFFNDSYDWRKFKLDVYKEWWYGVEITIDETDDNCIGYTLKYCLKPYTSTDPSPHTFQSRRPYIGYAYLTNDTVDFLFNSCTDVVNSVLGKQRVPRIYRDKYLSPIYETQKEIQKAYAKYYVERKEDKDKLVAYERGLTLAELQEQRRQIFVNRVWKQLKKKSL